MPRYLLGPTLGSLATRSTLVEQGLWRTEALMARSLWKLAGAMSPTRASDLGADLMGRLGPRLRKHRHVLSNLAVALPEHGPEELRAVAVEVWRNLGRVMFEFPHLGRYSGAERARWIDVVDRGGLAWIRRHDKPALFMTPHMANWNLSVTSTASVGIPLTCVYSRQSNPYLETAMARHREGMPCDFIDAADAGRALMDELRRGRSVGLLPDQRFDAGEMLPFFGREALTPISPIRVALGLKLPVLPARVERIEGGRFRVTIHEPSGLGLPPGDRRAQARDVMAQMYRHFEEWIREKPGEWLCAKRRWPKPASAAA